MIFFFYKIKDHINEGELLQIYFEMLVILSDTVDNLNDYSLPYDDPQTIFFDTGNLAQEQASAKCEVKYKINDKPKQTIINDFIFGVDFSPDLTINVRKKPMR